MNKPVFWNSIGIYLLLYNNILLIISLILSMKALIEGTATFSSAVWYQILVFIIYLLVVAGLFMGGKIGYVLAVLFIPFIVFLYFYPPLMVSMFPKIIMQPFRLVELVAFIYLVLSPKSREYLKNC
ncbi:hypothetical protein ACYSNW_15325 [Enterococcus sp. LJL99]